MTQVIKSVRLLETRNMRWCPPPRPSSPTGRRGREVEHAVRGDQVASEYLHKEMLDADGWFVTSDAAGSMPEGYVYFDASENISPAEIEDVLRFHPAVSDVAIVGQADDRWGERIVAIVVSRHALPPPIGALAAWLRDRLRSTKTLTSGSSVQSSLFQFRASLCS